ncbi:COMM domain-containing protein 10 [Parasteatoda tepidariorum]|uniref:COMM domain-containing protein 10 n=1 Tax=Parasteatoda tepidariorum TaxID=114398 RepID=UPI00077F831E|nr:COMM domain-containing protein 10 [Parasteatoda tepidariorum]
MSNSMFVKSERIQKAVALINGLEPPKFPLLLNRILQKIHSKEEVFTKEECSKLEVSLAVNQEQLKLILQTLTFIFQQAAYHVAKPAVLSQNLQQIDLNEEKISTIVQTWVTHAKNVVEKLKQKSIAPKQLSDVNWELRLQMANSSMSKLKVPIGLMELTLASNEGSEKLQMEFSHDELYSFYNQLEVIQTQLDALR